MSDLGRNAGKVLYKGRWLWVIGVISLFVLNFVVLYNVQRAVQETEVTENRLKEKATKLDIMWKDIRKKQQDSEEQEKRVQALEAQLAARDQELSFYKKREKEGKGRGQDLLDKKQQELLNQVKVEQQPMEGIKPIEPPRHVGPQGGQGIKVPSSTNITERLGMLSDPNQIMNEASEWMFQQIDKIQNPDDCSEAKYMYCPVVNSCGGGCVIHQLAYCMLVGYANKRVTIIGDGFKYLRDCPGGNSEWSCMFEIPTKCPPNRALDGQPWSEALEKSGAVSARVDLFSRASYDRNYYPWAASDGFHTKTPFWAPPEIAPFLKKIHGDPRVWVVGHLESYLLRFNNDTLDKLLKLNGDIVPKFQHPIAGVHVRRTDHRVEAPFRELSEYMVHVKKWFDDMKHTGDRYVYLASDEPQVINEAVAKWTDYKWLFHSQNGAISGAVGNNQNYQNDRSSMTGTLALLSDWYFLQRVDYLVGTSSSQVTRMAYELMQRYHTDASKLFVSLDDPWYFP